MPARANPSRPGWWRRAHPWQRVLVVSAAAVGLILATAGFHTVARLSGWLSERMEPAELSALLAPHYTIAKPDGVGPFPTAILFHGCDGVADNMHRWADALVADGWAAVIVDSHTPRSILDYDMWRLVCAGQLLPGAERAGDVMTAISDASAMPFVDQDRLALIGMSHGGWSIMELLALDTAGRVPFNLTRPPAALSRDGLSGVQAVILVYPWCGLANRARRRPWAHDAPALFLLARDDVIAPAAECERVADALEAAGKDVSTVVYPDVTHGFDQMEHTPLSTLVFDEAATRDAIANALATMDRAVGRAAPAS